MTIEAAIKFTEANGHIARVIGAVLEIEDIGGHVTKHSVTAGRVSRSEIREALGY